jgi:hypothetical protein
MFWAFKLSFVVDILDFFDLATFWAILYKILANFLLIIWSPCLRKTKLQEKVRKAPWHLPHDIFSRRQEEI